MTLIIQLTLMLFSDNSNVRKSLKINWIMDKGNLPHQEGMLVNYTWIPSEPSCI